MSYGRRWWDRVSGAFSASKAPKLVPPAEPTITWQRLEGDDARESVDGYWTIRRVVTFELQRQGVVIGFYDDEEQAIARAEIDSATRAICRGSEQDPWRSHKEGGPLGDYGECQVCGGWWRVRADGMLVVHPTPRRQWQRET